MSNAMFAVKYAGAAPHPSRGFTACPWKICVAASASPLFVLFVHRRCEDRQALFLTAHWIENFTSHAFACVPCAIVSLHEEAGPHTMKKGFVVCEPAFFVGATSAKGSRRKARRKTVREYRYTPRTRPASVAGQFVRAALYLCGLPRIRSPAPRRDVVRPLEKEPVRFPQNRRRRGGLTRPAVCTVTVQCRSVAFLLVASTQGITN